jgi:hypothetical protein
MPYAFLDSVWEMTILGRNLTYSLNGVLCFLSIFRGYIIFKIIKAYNIYTQDRSRRLLKFFNIKELYLFLYRSNMQYRSFTTIFIIAVFVLTVFSMIVNILENFGPDDQFYDIGNCIWFLISTMTTSNDISKPYSRL